MSRMAERWLAEEPGRIDMELCEHDHQMETADPQRLIRADETSWNYFVRLTTERETMKATEMIQSKFLKKEDFDRPTVLTIKHVSLEEVGKGENRWVIFFREKAKGIVLNATKIKQLSARFGDDTDDWTGNRIKVEHDPDVTMGGNVVGGIKFTMPPAGEQRAVVPPAPPLPTSAPAGFEDPNDDIPF